MKKITITMFTSLLVLALTLLPGCGKVSQEDFFKDSQVILTGLTALHNGSITEEAFRTNFDQYTEKYSGKLSGIQQKIYTNLREAYGSLMEARLSSLLNQSGEADKFAQELSSYTDAAKGLLP